MRERVLLGMPAPRSGLAVVGVLTCGSSLYIYRVYFRPHVYRMCWLHPCIARATRGQMLMLVRGVPHHDHARSSTMTLGPSRASASSTIRRPGPVRERVSVKVGSRLGVG